MKPRSPRTTPFELRVLARELLQALRFRHVHPAELRSPPVERLLRDVVQPAHLADVPRLLSLVQNANNLFFRESLPLPLVSDQPKRLTQRQDPL